MTQSAALLKMSTNNDCVILMDRFDQPLEEQNAKIDVDEFHEKILPVKEKE